jgi:transcriptional regulator with XRE-family HTH domain
MQQTVRFDLAQLAADMAARGWGATDLARRAKVSDSTVSRFFNGDHQTAKTMKKLAVALGYSVRRYVLQPHSSAPSSSSPAAGGAM